MSKNWTTIEVHMTDTEGVRHALSAGEESPDSVLTIDQLRTKAVVLVDLIDAIERKNAGEIDQDQLDKVHEAASRQ